MSSIDWVADLLHPHCWSSQFNKGIPHTSREAGIYKIKCTEMHSCAFLKRSLILINHGIVTCIFHLKPSKGTHVWRWASVPLKSTVFKLMPKSVNLCFNLPACEPLFNSWVLVYKKDAWFCLLYYFYYYLEPDRYLNTHVVWNIQNSL